VPDVDFALITLISALVGGLTLVSGFGLGTLLMPAFAIFFPLEIAIAATGVVHFVNNLFKLAVVGRWARREVVVRFGLPAVVAGALGAGLMNLAADLEPVHAYAIGSMQAQVTWLKLVIALLLVIFAALELSPRYGQIAFPMRALPIGGVLSGFFGGISGMQGALRAPFLLRAGLSQEEYVGTANVISTLVDFIRLTIYAVGFLAAAPGGGDAQAGSALQEPRTLWLIVAACGAGFLGAFLGAKIVRKVTLRAIRLVVAVMLFVAAGAMGAGVV